MLMFVQMHKMMNIKQKKHPLSVPPSKPYFELDATTHWVAGKRYAVTCVARDAKPEAEITFSKGKLPFWQKARRSEMVILSG